MRSISVLSSVALASLVAVGPAAATAVAGDDGGTRHDVTSFGFTVTPSTVAAGGTVTLSATGCEAPVVTVDSPVFDRTTLDRGRPATAQVYPDANRGARYDVTFTCGREKGTTTLTIAGGGSTSPTPAPVDHGVRAGVGGSIGGTDPLLLAGGGALIAGALGAGYLRLRKHRSDAA
jgi:hypothetical protein